MSVVTIGGNECMRHWYEEIYLGCGCNAKVYTIENSAIKKKIGTPDLIVFFTNTVSHKMVTAASQRGIRHCKCLERKDKIMNKIAGNTELMDHEVVKGIEGASLC